MYLIEGNIGVGKSTFLNLIQKNFNNVDIFYEPLGSWDNNSKSKSLLQMFYENPSRWTYTLELQTLISRAKQYLKIQESKTKSINVMERSIYSGYYCFAKNGLLHNNFSDKEWDMYSTWASFFFQKKCPPPSGFIYLSSEAKVCLERINLRARKSESAISLKYLQEIKDKHDEFLLSDKDNIPHLKDVPVIVIDCNQDFENNLIVQQKHLATLKDFFHQPQKKHDPPKETVLT